MRRPTLSILLVVTLAAGLAGPATGQEEEPPRPENVVPPPPPEALTEGEEIEPEVTIVEREWATFEEYSVDGQVYAVKVSPAVGPPYFLYDSDGDGELETRSELRRGVPATHQWKILTW